MTNRSALGALFLFCGMFAGAASLGGQSPPDLPATQPAIATDRPAITDSSIVVPRGDLQFENGFTETGSKGQHSFDCPATLVRFGLGSTTELRFNTPDYFQNINTGGGFSSGWGDLALGVKQQLVAKDGSLDASLVVSLSLPTGVNAISSHGYDPQFQAPMSYPISKNWTVAGMLSLSWPTQGASRNLTGQGTLLLDRQITSPWDAFVEYAGTFPQQGGPQHLLHAGTAYKITSNQQIDFHFGLGLSSAAVDHFIGFGYSFRLRAIHREKHLSDAKVTHFSGG
jgi:hypothetical protein